MVFPHPPFPSEIYIQTEIRFKINEADLFVFKIIKSKCTKIISKNCEKSYFTD